MQLYLPIVISPTSFRITISPLFSPDRILLMEDPAAIRSLFQPCRNGKPSSLKTDKY